MYRLANISYDFLRSGHGTMAGKGGTGPRKIQILTAHGNQTGEGQNPEYIGFYLMDTRRATRVADAAQAKDETLLLIEKLVP